MKRRRDAILPTPGVYFPDAEGSSASASSSSSSAGLRVVRFEDGSTVVEAVPASSSSSSDEEGRFVTVDDDDDDDDDGTFEWGGEAYRVVDAATLASSRGVWRLRGPLGPDFFFDDLRAAAACVRDRGVAVVREALTREELDRARAGVWSWLERFAGGDTMTRDAPATWCGPCFSESHGVVFTAGQCEGSWVVRAAARVVEAFRAVWGENHLITSMDGLVLWRPWDASSWRNRRTRGGWIHYDDDEVAFNGRCTVQGLVLLTDANAAMGGFVCCPGTHHGWDLDEAVTWRHVECPAGSLILWDSRCLHGSEPGSDCTAFDPADLLRVAVPVCMVPRAAATADQLAARLQAHAEARTTTHRPHRPDLLFAAKLSAPPPPDLDDAMRRLL